MITEDQVVWVGAAVGRPKIYPVVIEHADGFEPVYIVSGNGLESSGPLRMPKPENAIAFFGLSSREQCALLDRAEMEQP